MVVIVIFKLKILAQKAQRIRTDSSRPHRGSPAFSLAELMAVIGIMILIAAAAVPALRGLTGSGGRRQAMAQVLGAMEVARNTAIATGTNAAVIFPDASFASGEEYKYRSMAVVAWDPTNSTASPSMKGAWIVLPQGIAFFPASLASGKMPLATNVSFRLLNKSVSANFPAIIFQWDGALAEDASPIPTNGVAFFEGKVSGTTTNSLSKMTTFETVRLTRYTGRAVPTLAPAP